MKFLKSEKIEKGDHIHTTLRTNGDNSGTTIRSALKKELNIRSPPNPWSVVAARLWSTTEGMFSRESVREGGGGGLLPSRVLSKG